MELTNRVHFQVERNNQVYNVDMPYGASLTDALTALAEIHNHLRGVAEDKLKEQQEVELDKALAQEQATDKEAEKAKTKS